MDIALIPESAPFNAEQRAWLNGFLAGWVGLEPQTLPEARPVVAAPPEAEPEPWHDPALVIDRRLQLAEGKPLSHRLMAAMAQLDCGTCGYVCRTYAEAIAGGAEPRLSLCSPGGAETTKAIKRIIKERPDGASTNGVHVDGAAKDGVAKTVVDGWSRDKPYSARILRSVKLNRDGSEKETRHVEIDLGDDGPSYSVGDSLGVYPENCDALVDEIIAALGARGDESVTAASGPIATLRTALVGHRCLSEITEDLLGCLAGSAADPSDADQLRRLIDDDGPIDGFDVLDLLRLFPSARPAPEAFAASLAAIKPRLYSISSSPRRHAGQVHLTVRRVAYERDGRRRKGVASTMLADRVGPGSRVRVFVQASHGFALPADPSTPIIMIGPGTGIAPFRAFLHERDATGAPGKNWLFFGDQRGACDFLYEDELAEFLRRGLLSRLDTAFSRDQDRKLYVQHRLVERGEELFRWLRDGAHVYVCGDAKRMAADVDRALREVIRDRGRMSEDEAGAYIAMLVATGRYRRDVY